VRGEKRAFVPCKPAFYSGLSRGEGHNNVNKGSLEIKGVEGIIGQAMLQCWWPFDRLTLPKRVGPEYYSHAFDAGEQSGNQCRSLGHLLCIEANHLLAWS